MESRSLFSLDGKTILVTGATGHLGNQIALSLASAGAEVIVHGRTQHKVNNVVTGLLDKGFKAKPALFDLNSRAEIVTYFEKMTGSLDVIVNNAYSGKGGTIETSTPEDYSFALNLGLISAATIVQHALPKLRRSSSPSIINIASMYGMISPELSLYSSPESSNPPFYGAAKAALIQWTKYAAVEFGKEGIRVNSISPGAFPNDLVCENQPSFVKKLAKKTALNRIGSASELAGPVIFLASDASSYITGANLVVDGGWTAI